MPWAAGWPNSTRILSSSEWVDRYLVYDGLKLAAEFELDPAGELLRRYIYDGQSSSPAIFIDYTPEFSDDFYAVLTDDRGSVMGLVTDDGTLVEQLYYNSTGLCKSWDPASNSWNTHPDNAAYNLGRSEYIPFGYLGMYRDRFTGKYHTHYREYDPVHARWLSEDPAGYADGLNLYNAYMGVNGVDPLGLETPWRKKANSITSEYKRFVEAREAYLNGGGSLESIYKDKFGDYPEYYYTGKQTATAYDPDIHTSWDGVLISHSDYAERIANLEQSQPWWEENPTLHNFEHLALDVIGTFDPSPATDIYHAGVHAAHGEMRDAKITFIVALGGALLADALKFGKYSDEVGDYAEMFENISAKNVDNAADLGQTAKGGTYVLKDGRSGQIMRSGRSNNLLRRRAEHSRDPLLKDYMFEPVHRTDVYKQQRGLEQFLHDMHNPPLNKVRPISPKNPRRQKYIDAAEEFLK